MARPKGSKNKSIAPADIDQARKMARIRSKDAAPLWGMTSTDLQLKCLRGEVPDAVKNGLYWYVTPAGMDRMFELMKRKRRRFPDFH